MKRTQTKQIHVGPVAIGGGAPVAVQSMCNTHTSDARATIEQIAQRMECKKEEVVLALESVVDPVSLYEPVYSDGGDTIYVMDQVGDSSDDSDWLQEISLRDAIRALGEREKRILTLRFLSGRTQTEVAKEIGISQAQVSRLEKSALERIKRQMHDE